MSSCLRASHSCYGLDMEEWVHTKTQRHEGLMNCPRCTGQPRRGTRRRDRDRPSHSIASPFAISSTVCSLVAMLLNQILTASQTDLGTTKRAPPNGQEDRSLPRSFTKSRSISSTDYGMDADSSIDPPGTNLPQSSPSADSILRYDRSGKQSNLRYPSWLPPSRLRGFARDIHGPALY